MSEKNDITEMTDTEKTVDASGISADSETSVAGGTAENDETPVDIDDTLINAETVAAGDAGVSGSAEGTPNIAADTKSKKRKLPPMSRMQKIIVSVATVLIIAMIVTAVAVTGNKYTPGEYNKTKYSASGGAAQEHANLNKLEILSGESGRSDIRFSFCSGSDVISECGIPEYSVEFLQAPLRLKVTFKALEYWDYIIAGTPSDAGGIIKGMFRMTNTETNETAMYFNLSGDVTFKVSESGNALTVSMLKSAKDKNAQGWYLLCDLYYEYQEGKLPVQGFTPTLCSDNISVLMISEKYSSEAEANAKRDELLSGELEGVNIRVVMLDRFTLPEYSENTDALALLNESVLSVNGAKKTLPLFFADARFLCWLPDNSGALFSKPEESGEMFYVADKDGTKRRLLDKSFATIVKAAYSGNGKYLSFVEQKDDVSLVTVADIESGELNVIGSGVEAKIFGDMIISIAMNDDGSKLFCLSGDQIYSLKEYDVNTKEIVILASDIITESDITYNDGYLYYCDIVDEAEAVVRTSTREFIPREMIARGAQFSLSPDGRFLAVLTEDYDTAVCDLRVVNITDKSSEVVQADIVSGEFFIANDSRTLFYITETGDEEFYYQIMEYDISEKQSTVMAQCVNAVFFPSDKPNEIVISVIYTSDGVTHPVTYLADFAADDLSAEE